ncbi:MAG TPA: TlpA disulfide reductase family protein [Steroidobacteraceae bacterium]|nr:TlpA disulfide reductase family protein [Steroidobacteraceae bacterium]
MTSRPSSPAGALTLVGVLVVCAALGFLFHRLTSRHETDLRPVAGVMSPAGAQAPASPPPPPPIPEKLPDISLPDTSGKPHHLSEWSGQTLIVNFWATWCEPCRREIPLLKSLRLEKSRNRTEIVGIAVDHLDSVRKYVEDMHIDYPILVGEQGGLEAAAAFGAEPVLPFTAFADSQGDIVSLKFGELHPDEAAFILARLADLDAGRLGLAAARRQITEELHRLALTRTGAPAAAAN